MPAKKSFWNSPHEAPATLKEFKGNFLHHVTLLESAVSCIGEGIHSHDFAKRAGKRLGPFLSKTPAGYEGNDFVCCSRKPFFYQMQRLAFPTVSFVCAVPERNANDVNADFDPWNQTNVKVRIPTRQIAAVVIAKGRIREKQLAAVIRASQEKGIPVYRANGKRIWP